MDIPTTAATTPVASSSTSNLEFLEAMLNTVDKSARPAIQAQIDAARALMPAHTVCAFALNMVKRSLRVMEARLARQPNGVPSTLLLGTLVDADIQEKAFKDAKSYRVFQKSNAVFENAGSKLPVRMSVSLDMLRRAENLQAPFIYFNFATTELEVRRDQPQRTGQGGTMEYLFNVDGNDVYLTKADKDALAVEGKTLTVVHDYFLVGNAKIVDFRNDIYGGPNPEGLTVGTIVQEDEIDEDEILNQLLRRQENIAANRERNRAQQTAVPTLDLNATKTEDQPAE